MMNTYCILQKTILSTFGFKNHEKSKKKSSKDITYCLMYQL